MSSLHCINKTNPAPPMTCFAVVYGSLTAPFDSYVKRFGASAASVTSPSQFLYSLSPQGYSSPLYGSSPAPCGSRASLASGCFRRASSTFPMAERTCRRAENNCPITTGFSLAAEANSRCAQPYCHAPPAHSQRTRGACHQTQPLFRMVRGHHPSGWERTTPIHHS